MTDITGLQVRLKVRYPIMWSGIQKTNFDTVYKQNASIKYNTTYLIWNKENFLLLP